ncbi:MAG: DUF6572 domain-containing protein [Bacteroidota bacterium]
MSIVQTNVIDAIGIDEQSNYVILTISDHLAWDDTESHLQLLQEKLNSYISFYESGEIFHTYPLAIDKDLVIQIIGKYRLNSEGLSFFNQAKRIVSEAKIELRFKQLNEE